MPWVPSVTISLITNCTQTRQLLIAGSSVIERYDAVDKSCLAARFLGLRGIHIDFRSLVQEVISFPRGNHAVRNLFI